MGKGGPKLKIRVDCKWSSNLAYAVGLIATDGCLIKNRFVVDVSSKDLEQLENFSKAIGLNLKIGNKKSGLGKKSYRVQLNNRRFYEFLLSIGLFPNKSKTLSELNIPDRYFWDFLRGCFDGDGTFYSYWDKRWKSSFMYYLEFASASENFINWLKKRINTGYITRAKGKSTFQLKFAKTEARSLIEKMYKNEGICLSRKRLKIKKVLGTIG